MEGMITVGCYFSQQKKQRGTRNQKAVGFKNKMEVTLKKTND